MQRSLVMRDRMVVSGRVLCLLLVIAGLAVTAAGDWPVFHHDLVRSGYTQEYSEYDGFDLVLLWNYTTNGSIFSSPVCGDLDGDGWGEVVFGSDDGFVYALNYSGNLVWRHKTGGRVRSAPSVVNLSGGGNLSGSGFLQVLVGSEDGFVYAIAHNGSLLWRFRTGGPVTSSPVVADVYNGPKPGVVFGSADGRLYVLYADGREFWSYGLMAPVEHPLALADMDGDGLKDFVFGSADKLNVLFMKDFRVIISDAETHVTTAPLVDGGVVYVGTEGGRLYGFERTSVSAGEDVIPTVYGKEYWANRSKTIEVLEREDLFNCSKGIYSTVSYANLDLNTYNGNEYVFGCNDGNLYILAHRDNDTAFTRVFKYTTSKAVRSSPALVDFNNDSYVEIVFGSDDGFVYVLNSTGYGRWAYNVGGKVAASPAVSDLNHDDFVDLMVGSTNGVFYFFVSKGSTLRAEGRLLYDEARRLLDTGDFENATEWGLKAKAVYDGIGYSKGSGEVDSLFLDISSREHCSRAVFFYRNGFFRDAIEEIETADYIYSSAGRPFKSPCNDLLVMANAIFYYREAQSLLDAASFGRARAYAQLSNNFSVMSGDSAMTVQSSLLVERIDDLEAAQNLFSEAFGDYYRGVDGTLVLAKMDRAEKVYRDRNASQGLLDIVRNEADKIRVEVYLGNVTMLFNSSMHEESYGMAVRTRDMCAGMNNTDCVRKAEEYINKTRVYVDANEALGQARRYYTATDFITASEYARKARDAYLQTGNQEKIMEAEELLNRSLGMTGSMGGRTMMDELSNPAVVILAIQVVVLVVIVVTRPKARVVFRGFKGMGGSINAKRVDYAGMGMVVSRGQRLRKSR